MRTILSSTGFLLIASVFLLVSADVLRGQSTAAELRGTIQDQSGAVIPNAEVAARNLNTRIVRTAYSNSAGVFSIPHLPPSAYEVLVNAAGFATLRISVVLTVGAQQVLDATLTPAQTSTTVEVTGAAPAVDLASSALGGVADAKTTRELPLNGRDWTQLATLQPGVAIVRTQNTLNGSSSNRGSRGLGTEMTINGSRPNQNNYFLDGISQNDYANASPGSVLGLTLGVDAIEEFSVLTSSYNASYGQTSGGVINAATRSGTNGFHGDVYEFLRNDKLDARNFFDQLGKPPFRRNQFGVAAGGPIRRDRTFIFANYEGLRQALTNTLFATVPSENARAGNLCSIPVNPCTPSKVNVDPAVKPFLVLWRLPNAGLLGNGDTGQYSFSAPSPSSENFGSAKVDQYFSSNDNMSAAYSVDDGNTQIPDSNNSIFVNSTLRRNTGSIHETHIFSPDMLNSVRVGINRVTAHALASSPGNNPAAVDPTLSVLPGRNAPFLSVPGITTYSGGVNGTATTNFWYTTYQLYDDLSIQKHRHSFKAGLGFTHFMSNMQVASVPNGEFDFGSLSGFLTNRPTTFFADLSYAPGQTSGLGNGAGFPKRGFRQNVFSLYFQDDLRLREHLTVNLGLRYEISSNVTESHHQLANLRDIYGTDPNAGKALFRNPTLRNFEPRLGLAWDPFRNGKTSVRAAFGVFDLLPLIYEYGAQEAYTGPFSSLVQLNQNALPPGSFPNGGVAVLLSGNPVPLRYTSLEYAPPRNYILQWNASIERSLTPNLTLLVAYSASRGVHMVALANDVNLVLPSKTPQGYLWPSPAGSGMKVNPALGGIRQFSWGDDSFYHGLQTRIQKRFSRGFQLQTSFTWSKSIDGYSSSIFPTTFQNSVTTLFIDRKLNRGPSDFHIGRVLVINGLWELPKSQSAPKALQAVTNGWGLSGIFQATDGLPFTPLISGDPTGQLSGGSYDVPNRVVGGACTNLVNPRDPNHYINTSCYSFPVPATLLGNAGRNSLIGPGLVEIDLAVTRNFPIRFISEAARLQFRAEGFNVANRANFQPPIPNNRLFSVAGAPIAAAGVITSTATTARQFQMALKLVW